MKTVYYASVGPDLTLYDVDVEGAALVKRTSVALPANIQYAWPHPSRRHLYVVSSNGGPTVAGDKNYAHAFTIDSATGALRPHGGPAALPTRSIHTTVDANGEYLLTAYNNPSNITVHRINGDGSLGASVPQPHQLDTGIYAHQVRVAPSNRVVTLVTRGNDATPAKPEDPGAIKTFRFQDGVLSNLASIAPGNGLGFGPRHLDFHPTKPWAFISIERQNQLYAYQLDENFGLARTPSFIKGTMRHRTAPVRQAAGAIHVHPGGKFVYLTNRTSDLTEFAGQKVFAGGENGVAVFALDQQTGEPTLIQTIDGQGIHLRTFGIDPTGRVLVAASVMPLPVRDANGIGTLTAGITVFRMDEDGRLDFVRKYDIDTGGGQQFWSGMVTLPT